MVGHFNVHDKLLKQQLLPATRFIFQFHDNEKVFLRFNRYSNKEEELQKTISGVLRGLGGMPEFAFSNYNGYVLPKHVWFLQPEYKPPERAFYTVAHQLGANLLIKKIKENPAYHHVACDKGISIVSLGCGDGLDLMVCEKAFTKEGFKCTATGFDSNTSALVENIEKYPEYQFIPLDLEDMNNQFPKILQKGQYATEGKLVVVIAFGSITQTVLKGTRPALDIMHQLRIQFVGHLFIQTGWTRPLINEEIASAAGWDITTNDHSFGDDPSDRSSYRLLMLGDRQSDEKTFEVTLSRSKYRSRYKNNSYTFDLSFTSNPFEQCQLLEKNADLSAQVTQLDLSWSHLNKTDIPLFFKIIDTLKTIKFIIISKNEPWADFFIEELKHQQFSVSFQLIQRTDSACENEIPTLSVSMCRELKIYSSLPYKPLLKIVGKSIEEKSNPVEKSSDMSCLPEESESSVKKFMQVENEMKPKKSSLLTTKIINEHLQEVKKFDCKEGARNYIHRLEAVLGNDVVKKDPKNLNSVSFPVFWLKQLGENAIEELSSELGVPLINFRPK